MQYAFGNHSDRRIIGVYHANARKLSTRLLLSKVQKHERTRRGRWTIFPEGTTRVNVSKCVSVRNARSWSVISGSNAAISIELDMYLR